MDRAEYAEALHSSLEAQGYGSNVPCKEDAEQLADLVADWPVGTIVERRLDMVTVRAWPHELTGQGRTG